MHAVLAVDHYQAGLWMACHQWSSFAPFNFSLIEGLIQTSSQTSSHHYPPTHTHTHTQPVPTINCVASSFTGKWAVGLRLNGFLFYCSFHNVSDVLLFLQMYWDKRGDRMLHWCPLCGGTHLRWEAKVRSRRAKCTLFFGRKALPRLQQLSWSVLHMCIKRFDSM